MGLFKKTDDKAAKSDLDALQAELDALKARLEAADVAKAALEVRLASLDATTQQLSARPATAPTDPVVIARLDTLASQVASLDQASSRTAAQVNELATSAGATDPARGSSELAQFAERLAANDAAVRAAAEQLAAVEQRITSISVELANQINELGHDIDALNSSAPMSGNEPASLSSLSDEVLDALRTAQVRLASEQARYEIAFREDLAALAEQIRRSARG